jgi:hypothetical protein
MELSLAEVFFTAKVSMQKTTRKRTRIIEKLENDQLFWTYSQLVSSPSALFVHVTSNVNDYKAEVSFTCSIFT